MNIQDFVDNCGSTTKIFSTIPAKCSIGIISSSIINEIIKRSITISLDKTVVMLATSATNIHDKTFYDILQNSDTKPIGLRLFAKDSKIIRDRMDSKETMVHQILDVVLKNKMHALGYFDNSLIFERTSTFLYNTEKMKLVEYILPSITKFLNLI